MVAEVVADSGVVDFGGGLGVGDDVAEDVVVPNVRWPLQELEYVTPIHAFSQSRIGIQVTPVC